MHYGLACHYHINKYTIPARREAIIPSKQLFISENGKLMGGELILIRQTRGGEGELINKF